MRSCRSKFLACAGTALAALSLGAASASAAASATTRLGTRAAIPSAAQPLGTLASGQRLTTTVTLAPQDASALQSFVQSVSTPGSPAYHQYLTVAQFAQRFGPTSAQISEVRSVLAADGLTLGALSANDLSFTASGTAKQISQAFAVTLRHYRLPSGRVGFAAGSAPAVPSSIASDVQGVLGLDTLVQAQRMSLKPAHPLAQPQSQAQAGATADAAVSPCSAASTAGSEYGAYTPDQFAQAYSFNPLYSGGDTGAGASVALYELEPHLSSDISAYQSCMGTSATVTQTNVDGGAGSGAGEGEAALDIEDVIGLAPAASIDVYNGPNTESGAYDTYAQIVSDDTSQVISTSWGLCEASEGSSSANSENTLFEEAASQGQSVFAAAGDSGADDCGNGTRAVDDPASQPDVTGVGGTHLASDTAAASQTVWNDGSGQGAGGGGTSTLWSAPSWQSAVTGGSSREVPDVSADADENTGYVVYYDGSWTAIGGTSAAAPLWASLAALADSSCGSPIGLANPALYAAETSSPSDFDDVTSGNNSYEGVTGFNAGSGYDEASGLGTPVASSLAPALCG
ncbi:MAG TPA: S53 family peptidase [Solirubrobacteraceae bacterium]|jgi:subtilase family serine protease